MNFWIDTHSHIYLEDFDHDLSDMFVRASQAGVQRIFLPNIDHTSVDRMMELESMHNSCFAMMGLHPCSVKKDFEKELYQVEQWLSRRKFAAIGEIGTDLYWDKTFWDEQVEAFTIQVNWAKQYNLPVVIHCRESLDQTIDLVDKLCDDKLTGVFHCFTGTVEQAARIAALGFYMGIGGVATFKKGGLDTVLPHVSMDHLVLETDSPYLAPVPHRGKRNEPSYISIIANRVAEILSCDILTLQQATTRNALKLFKQVE